MHFKVGAVAWICVFNVAPRNVPMDTAENADFRTFALNWWGKQPSINGNWTEREHSRQWHTEELFGSGAPNADLDGEGRSNFDERAFGTDPTKAFRASTS